MGGRLVELLHEAHIAVAHVQMPERELESVMRASLTKQAQIGRAHV